MVKSNAVRSWSDFVEWYYIQEPGQAAEIGCLVGNNKQEVPCMARMVPRYGVLNFNKKEYVWLSHLVRPLIDFVRTKHKLQLVR